MKNNDTELVKSFTLFPTLTAILKPSADIIGLELRDKFKNIIDSFKQRKQKENLVVHIKKAEDGINIEDTKESSIEQVKAFESWCDGAQDIDPNDTLAELWQQLLRDIIENNVPDKIVIKTLKNLTSKEAKILIKLPKHSNFFKSKDSEENRYYIENLEKLNLINYTIFSSNDQKRMMIMIMIMMITIFEFNTRVITYLLYDSPITITLFSVTFIAFVAIFLKKWRLTWLGKKVLEPYYRMKKNKAH